jgi:lipoprotein-anchoring transpeptidase ErfK/SrfK
MKNAIVFIVLTFLLAGLLFILFPKLFNWYMTNYKYRNWCDKYDVFTDLPKDKSSLFANDIADGFDLPVVEFKVQCLKFNVNDSNDSKTKESDVFTIGKGKAVYSDNCGKELGNIVMILHKYYENGEIKYILSEYTNLQDVTVKNNDLVERHKKIGTSNKAISNQPSAFSFHFEIRNEQAFYLPVYFNPEAKGKNKDWIKENYENPEEFINERKQMLLPAKMDTLIFVRKNNYRMDIIVSGKCVKTYEIALSQETGKKMNEGDNRTPEGEYRICQKYKGPFNEKDAHGYGSYLGTRWLGLSYPNKFDAKRALERGLIKKIEFDTIIASGNKNEMPIRTTYLGGGIGIHGWDGEWPEKLKDITWGCISMKKDDIEELYDMVRTGTVIIITK